MNNLTLALTKGRLEKKTINLFERIGMDCTPLHNTGRKLIHSLKDEKLDVVLAKAPDVITYVEHGVCDLGIVGKDTILEHGRSFYEVLDLGFGICRFALAAPSGSDFFDTYHSRRVASKYPNITKNYFTKKGLDVEIIKIEGSVELAPILGLADAIVDLVETGATLRENGLSVIEDITTVSARLIVNVASMKLHRQNVLELVRRCKEGVALVKDNSL